LKWKVLVSAPYLQPELDRFRKMFDKHGIKLLVPTVNERMEEKQLLEWIEEVDGAICGDDHFTEKVLRSASKLKVISKWGTGIDSIDLEACRKYGITVCNTPNAFSEPVADTATGYILCFARNLKWMDRHMREGVWHKIPGRALRECTLGIIGVGNIGKTLARRIVVFGMGLLGNDLVEMPADFLIETNIQMVSIEELLRRADFISLNCDLNPTSYHLMDDHAFSLMKPSAVIINTARGPLIDEQALIKALQEQRIAGAALDVFENEPLPANSPFRKMKNVMMAPHNANSSPQAWERVHQNTIKNLIEALDRNRE